MNIFFIVFQTFAWVLNLYTFVIFARILITWVPSWSQSAAGRFLATLCDPYINWFRRFGTFRTSTLDFTPVFAIGVLIMLSSILGRIVLMQRFSVGIIISVILSVSWSFVSSFLTFLIIFMAIRLIFNLLNRDSGTGFWQRMDAIISPVAYKISSLILPRRVVQYRTVLIAALAAFILIQFAGNMIFGFAERFFLQIPI